MRALYNNKITETTLLTVSSENTNYPKRFSYSTHRSEKFKFTGKTSEYIIIDLGSAIAIDTFTISGNLTSSATVNVEFNTANSWGAPASTVSITTTGNRELYQNFTTQTYRYVRITFADTTNTEDITIDIISIGVYLQTPGIEAGYDTSDKTTSVKNLSPSGQPYGRKGYNYKEHNFKFTQHDSNKRAEMQTFFSTVDVLEPFFLVILYDDKATFTPEYVTLTNSLGEKKKEHGLFFDGTMSTRESF